MGPCTNSLEFDLLSRGARTTSNVSGAGKRVVRALTQISTTSSGGPAARLQGKQTLTWLTSPGRFSLSSGSRCSNFDRRLAVVHAGLGRTKPLQGHARCTRVSLIRSKSPRLRSGAENERAALDLESEGRESKSPPVCHSVRTCDNCGDKCGNRASTRVLYVCRYIDCAGCVQVEN